MKKSATHLATFQIYGPHSPPNHIHQTQMASPNHLPSNGQQNRGITTPHTQTNHGQNICDPNLQPRNWENINTLEQSGYHKDY